METALRRMADMVLTAADAFVAWLGDVGIDVEAWPTETWLLVVVALLLAMLLVVRLRRRPARLDARPPQLLVTKGEVVPDTAPDLNARGRRRQLEPAAHARSGHLIMTVSNLSRYPVQLLELAVREDRRAPPGVVELAAIVPALGAVVVETPVPLGLRGDGWLDLYCYASVTRAKTHRHRVELVWEPWAARFKAAPMDQVVTPVRKLASDEPKARYLEPAYQGRAKALGIVDGPRDALTSGPPLATSTTSRSERRDAPPPPPMPPAQKPTQRPSAAPPGPTRPARTADLRSRVDSHERRRTDERADAPPRAAPVWLEPHAAIEPSDRGTEPSRATGAMARTPADARPPRTTGARGGPAPSIRPPDARAADLYLRDARLPEARIAAVRASDAERGVPTSPSPAAPERAAPERAAPERAEASAAAASITSPPPRAPEGPRSARHREGPGSTGQAGGPAEPDAWSTRARVPSSTASAPKAEPTSVVPEVPQVPEPATNERGAERTTVTWGGAERAWTRSGEWRDGDDVAIGRAQRALEEAGTPATGARTHPDATAVGPATPRRSRDDEAVPAVARRDLEDGASAPRRPRPRPRLEFPDEF